jgi:putative transposase
MSAFHRVMKRHPFIMEAFVILPDHVHCLWRMPAGDSNYSLRWRLIKSYFSAGFNYSVNERGKKEVWQRRFWEHLLRDDEDWRRHMDYIHYNPVKHGYVKSPGIGLHVRFRRSRMGLCSGLGDGGTRQHIENGFGIEEVDPLCLIHPTTTTT